MFLLQHYCCFIAILSPLLPGVVPAMMGGDAHPSYHWQALDTHGQQILYAYYIEITCQYGWVMLWLPFLFFLTLFSPSGIRSFCESFSFWIFHYLLSFNFLTLFYFVNNYFWVHTLQPTHLFQSQSIDINFNPTGSFGSTYRTSHWEMSSKWV